MVARTKASTVVKDAALPNFILIKFSYDAEYIFPYAKGIKILELLEVFEKYDTSDYNNPCITSINKSDTISVHIMGGKEYLDLKAKALLRVKNETK